MASFQELNRIWSTDLAKVFLSGDIGVASYQLVQVSKYFGIIHLLVLSGTQVGFFAAVSRAFWAPILRKIFRIDELYQRIFLGFFLVFWVRSFDFPPPLTRALFFELANLYSKNIRLSFLAPRIFLIHALLFPNHLATQGFYLSWSSFLLVASLRMQEMNRIKSTVVATIFCTLLFKFSAHSPWPGLSQWAGIIVANLTLGLVADRLWFPVLAGFHFFSFMGGIFGIVSEPQRKEIGIELMSSLIGPFLLPLMP